MDNSSDTTAGKRRNDRHVLEGFLVGLWSGIFLTGVTIGKLLGLSSEDGARCLIIIASVITVWLMIKIQNLTD